MNSTKNSRSTPRKLLAWLKLQSAVWTRKFVPSDEIADQSCREEFCSEEISMSMQHAKPRHGAVAVVVEDEKFLVIRRSALVRAPNLLCFAGGTIEVGESPQEAIVRELHEELGLVGTACEHLWQSRTSWGTLLEWVLVERHADSNPIANPLEVAEWMWLHPKDLLDHPDLLPSVPAFFCAWAKGDLQLPERAGEAHPGWSSWVP